METKSMGFASKLADRLPPPLLYRATALSFRLHREQRLLFVDSLVPEGCVAIDVGAWWGPWTYWLARRASCVWAFEPNPAMAAHLKGVVPPRVRVEQVALSDSVATATLWVSPHRGPDALGTLEEANRADGSVPMKIAVRPLDDYTLPEVDFVKIDVESHELQMLKGAEETLRRCRPNLLIEVEQQLQEEPIDTVFDFICDLGYDGWIRRQRSWESLGTFDVTRDQLDHVHEVKSPRYINNFVFTPAGSGLPGS